MVYYTKEAYAQHFSLKRQWVNELVNKGVLLVGYPNDGNAKYQGKAFFVEDCPQNTQIMNSSGEFRGKDGNPFIQNAIEQSHGQMQGKLIERWDTITYFAKKHGLKVQWVKEMVKFDLLEVAQPIGAAKGRSVFILNNKKNLKFIQEGKISDNGNPYMQKERKKRIAASNDTKEKISKAQAKTWFFRKDGKTIEIHNLRRYCDENNLSKGNMSQLAKGKLKSYKGYQGLQTQTSWQKILGDTTKIDENNILMTKNEYENKLK